jgi:hypothetical protein
MSAYKSTEELYSLYDTITKGKGKPIDAWEITALLETYGLRDVDAQNEYAKENLFELAKTLLVFIDKKDDYKLHSIQTIKESNVLKRIIQNYIKGLAFSLPMLIQIIFTVAVGYALWSSVDADSARATAISLGTFAALIVTGGSAQAIGHKGLFYLKLKEYVLAKNVSFVLLIVGAILIFILFIFLSFTNFFFDIFPMDIYVVAISYYLLLSVFFLILSVFFMFEDYFAIVFLTFLGLIFVYIFHTLLGYTLASSQIYGLVILNIVVVFVVYKKLKSLKDKNNSGEREGTNLPKPSILFYSLLPYYTYGTFYFAFLVVDRIIAWSTDAIYHPYSIWFNVSYELGLDWALISLILMMGVTEVSIAEFMYRINERVVKIKYKNAKEFSQEIYGFFKKFTFFFILFSLVVSVATFFLIYILNKTLEVDFLETFLTQPTINIFIISSIAYFFLVNSLMNILFMFSLSRHHTPVKSIAYGLFVNVFVGLILSRVFGYEYAVFGLLSGSLVLWFITFKEVKMMFKNLDYYYYSAY